MISTRDLIIAAVGALLVQVPAVRLASLLFLGQANPLQTDMGSAPVSALVVLLLAPSLAGIAWIWFFAIWREPGGWGRVGLFPPSTYTVLRAIVAGLAAVLLIQVVVAITPEQLGTPEGPPIPFDLALEESALPFRLVYGLGAAVLAPIFEEMLFRGLLFAWMRRHFAFLGSAVISALPHAAIHGDLAAIPALTAAFVLFAWLYERERTLVAPMIAHAVYNSTVLLLVLF